MRRTPQQVLSHPLPHAYAAVVDGFAAFDRSTCTAKLLFRYTAFVAGDILPVHLSSVGHAPLMNFSLCALLCRVLGRKAVPSGLSPRRSIRATFSQGSNLGEDVFFSRSYLAVEAVKV